MKKVIFHLCDLVRREERGEGESIVSLTEGRLRAGVPDIKEGGQGRRGGPKRTGS